MGVNRGYIQKREFAVGNDGSYRNGSVITFGCPFVFN